MFGREGVPAQKLVRDMIEGRVSRRDFVSRGLALGLSAASVMELLAACGNVHPQTTAAAGPAVGKKKVAAQGYPQDEANRLNASLTWPKSVVADPRSPVTISVAHHWDAAFFGRQQQYDQFFMERHPNIKVSAENTPGDYLTKYTTQAAAGVLPDLMFVQYAFGQFFYQQGQIEPLDSYIAAEKDFNLADFSKASLGFYRRGGKLYTVGYGCDVVLLFYNKDIFDAAGHKVPDSTWTMDDLKNAAIALTQGSGGGKQFGFGGFLPPYSAAIAPSFLYPWGAKFTNEPDETKCLLNSPQAVQAMQFWVDLQLKHGAIPSAAEVSALPPDPFTAGKAAMEFGIGYHVILLTHNADFNWDITDWPKGPAGRVTAAVGAGYSITKSSAQKDAAWVYLNEYMSTAGQSFMWASTSSSLPSRKSAWPAYVSSPYAPGNPQIMINALNSYASPDILIQPQTTKVLNTIRPIWNNVMNGQLSVKDGLDQIVKAVDPIMAQNK